MKKVFLFTFVLAITIVSCKNEKSPFSGVSEKSTSIEGKLVLTDSLVYGIATRANENADSSELIEFNTFLQGKLFDYVFNQLYEGKLKAYDFLSDEELSIDDVKAIEKTNGFIRSKVGKVQFNEQWFIDKNGNLLKKVNSMTLGVERFSKQGTFVGYNALFKIKFNTTAQ